MFWGGRSTTEAFTETDGSCDRIAVDVEFFDAVAGSYIRYGWRYSYGRMVSIQYPGIVYSDHIGMRQFSSR